MATKRKRSFFERLTGTIRMDDDVEDNFEPYRDTDDDLVTSDDDEDFATEEANEEGELSVDVYDTGNSIIVQGVLGGVAETELNIDITRETVTIQGARRKSIQVPHNAYLHRELYWGSFSRTIMLPEEIDIDEAKAYEDHGLLTLELPKANKERKAKLKVKMR